MDTTYYLMMALFGQNIVLAEVSQIYNKHT